MVSIRSRLLLAAVLSCIAAGSAAQVNKCVIKGKTVYQEQPCPGGVKPPAAGGGGPAQLPHLDPGLWKMQGEDPAPFCGDPLDSFRREFTPQFLDGARELGCLVDARSTATTFYLLVDCPKDAVKPGLAVSQGRIAYVITAPNMNSFTLELTHRGTKQTKRGTRIGPC